MAAVDQRPWSDELPPGVEGLPLIALELLERGADLAVGERVFFICVCKGVWEGRAGAVTVPD